nr:DEAD/DEAH box helicase family protein [uncultured Desulfobulbus sp.]
MEYQELLGQIRLLKLENKRLRDENQRLKAQLGETAPLMTGASPAAGPDQDSTEIVELPGLAQSLAPISVTSDVLTKIRIFRELFRGREDIYAIRWENRVSGKSGYMPVCLNRGDRSVCGRPQVPCSQCSHQNYAGMDGEVVKNHLLGKIVAGIYPLLVDETCWFLAIDFDDDGWREDITMIRTVCDNFQIPVAVERSRSGNGGHAWFFFEQPLSASLARKFGSAVLTAAMSQRHEIQFQSYDRLFPSQETMTKGGFGNLIALPLQKRARENQNSEFVDAAFSAYADQWAYLASVQRLTASRVAELVGQLCKGDDLGELRIDSEEAMQPWKKQSVQLAQSDFPQEFQITRANMLYIPKDGFSPRALNRLKRLASFKNPVFHRQQAMRLSTFGIPRIISCADETPDYLCLPRGCEDDLLAELKPFGGTVRIADRRNAGRSIRVTFKGVLRDEQPQALEQLLTQDTGILCGTTAFGKTVVAIKLIAERKVNTLILVDKTTLVRQWREKLEEFLVIHESLPEEQVKPKGKRGRKKKKQIIGQLGAGKNTLQGIVDIALMQSLSRMGEVKDCVCKYGMIIADECHHASAFTYEQILKATDARYIYGLTATPTRKDGHHPILAMQLGAIRYRDDARQQAEKRPFEHYVIPRFTSLRSPAESDKEEISIQQSYAHICEDAFRNEQIVEDVLAAYHNGRNSILLTLRTAHVEQLTMMIQRDVPHVVSLTGSLGARQARESLQRIREMPQTQNLVIVATGPFIGEGFDEPRLDTLFLAMPISWKGTLQQYAGRLHRLVDQKKEVQIYDYVDVHSPMLEKMYQKRLRGYASMGYKIKRENLSSAPAEIIFDQNSFLPVFLHDLVSGMKEILIVSPFLRTRRTAQMIENLRPAAAKRVVVRVITKLPSEFSPGDQVPFKKALALFEGTGITVEHRARIHQKFALIDRKIVWYGSVNLLSFGSAQESLMRIESTGIAQELEKTINPVVGDMRAQQ